MKYGWTPFIFLSLVFLGGGIYTAIEIALMKGEPGLGGLAPYILFGLSGILFFVDLFIQMLLSNRKALHIGESILIAAFIIWMIFFN